MVSSLETCKEFSCCSVSGSQKPGQWCGIKSKTMGIFPGGSVVKNPPAMQEMQVRSLPWRRSGNPLQYSGLGNFMDRGDWQAVVHGGLKKVRHDSVMKRTTAKSLKLPSEQIPRDGVNHPLHLQVSLGGRDSYRLTKESSAIDWFINAIVIIFFQSHTMLQGIHPLCYKNHHP